MHRTYFCFGSICILREINFTYIDYANFITGALESFASRFPSHLLIIFRMSQVDLLLQLPSVVFLFYFIIMEITGFNGFLIWWASFVNSDRKKDRLRTLSESRLSRLSESVRSRPSNLNGGNDPARWLMFMFMFSGWTTANKRIRPIIIQSHFY